MAVLDPKRAILDETDSGLDIDALRIVAGGVNSLRSKDRAIIVITHYQRLLNYIIPDRVHVMGDGRIVRSGDRQLALELEKTGYALREERRGTSPRQGCIDHRRRASPSPEMRRPAPPRRRAT